MDTSSDTGPGTRRAARAWEVFLVFLRLGCTSFGGPTAHLGYFREAFVERRRWLTDRAYADVVALCQFLPGPASSQVGMAIGLQRAGAAGLVAAWAGFTLPSAALMVGFAYGSSAVAAAIGTGWLTGLKAAAVAVVAHAVVGMARSLTTDLRRALIAVGALVIVLVVPGVLAQVAAIGAAGLAGWCLLRPAAVGETTDAAPLVRVPRAVSVGSLIAFVTLLIVLPLAAAASGGGVLTLVDVFYRAGSLVFGGGHVVLPLLDAEVVQTGMVGHDSFMAGYGAAQAVPGPLFTFAAYLGAVMGTSPSGVAGAVIALLAIFVPSVLLIVGVLPMWERVRRSRRARRVLDGLNAGVVGLLGAALYNPVFTEGVRGWETLCIAVAAFLALTIWRVPAWLVVIAAAAVGWAIG